MKHFYLPLLVCSFYLSGAVDAQDNAAREILGELATHGFVPERFVQLRGQSECVAASDVKCIEQVWGLALS